MSVAVKETLPRTLLTDVRHEASILAPLSHPYVPYLFGVCTKHRPYCIVMQYHGCSQSSISSTFLTKLCDKSTDRDDWFTLFSQMVEGVRYLHDDAKILHNDLM